jgi:hypothetical protein
LSVDERAAILGRTCQRWYRFGDERAAAEDIAQEIAGSETPDGA